MAEFYGYVVKAHYVLKDNITTLLRVQGKQQVELVKWCRRSESWLSKILGDPNRGLPLKYLDRIAEFFGVETYQLIQPGLSGYTDRRSGKERRSGSDRRMSTEERLRVAIGSDTMRVAAALVTNRAVQLAKQAKAKKQGRTADTVPPTKR